MLNLPNVLEKESLQAKVFFKLGNYFNKINQKDSAYYYYFNSNKLFLKDQDSINIIKNLVNLAILESDFGSYATSDSTIVASLKYIGRKKNKILASAYNCLAINSKKQFLYDDAISYYKKAIAISKIKTSKNIYKSNIANVYKELKEYSKAILILENLLKDSIKNLKTKARVIDNLAHIKWLNNSKENVLKEFLFAESVRNNKNDKKGLIASYSHLSDYYRKANQKKSLIYAKKKYRISKELKNVTGQLEAINQIVTLLTPQNSIKYYKKSIHLKDSLKEANTKIQHKFAKIKYNFEEEEKQKLKFKTLATENELIAEQENNQKKNVLILGIIITSSLLFLLYRRKQQHKKRILQESYNTETRIAKKLHDELGNGLFNTLTKIQNPNLKIEEIVKDLDKIYMQTRSISHEHDSVETGTKFEDYFRNLLASYNTDSCKIILKDLSVLSLNSLSEEKQIVFYRVFNELLVNMKKHSKASLVVLSCKKINNVLEIKYSDNGVGFEGNKIIFKNGLKNMETRIKTIKGTLNFDEQGNNGFKTTICFKK
ncbi:tetratricopeptide repeat-containing sensor histidine kinase [Polaribacter sp. ALD11]|uniref:tetratricopeptide repeat-containing sensor histidine kinase n=1 Tax=Polaribacter sp. ALD11 TaxID=2058137 RepID=UPI0012FE555E|nr:tetratricopeptide repeat-containing sensor histidine kinase [Polaribacter sp. ALD11]